MDALEAIRTRRSIRRFKHVIPQEDVTIQLIQAACKAPSAGNSQPWKFMIVKNEEIKKQLAKAHAWSGFIKEAPICIVALSNERISPSYFAIDTSCAIENILIAAHALGLGACWVAVYDPRNPAFESYVRDVLRLPKHLRIIAVIPIGYPDESPERRELRCLDELIQWIN